MSSNILLAYIKYDISNANLLLKITYLYVTTFLEFLAFFVDINADSHIWSKCCEKWLLPAQPSTGHLCCAPPTLRHTLVKSQRGGRGCHETVIQMRLRLRLWTQQGPWTFCPGQMSPEELLMGLKEECRHLLWCGHWGTMWEDQV